MKGLLPNKKRVVKETASKVGCFASFHHHHLAITSTHTHAYCYL